MLYVLTLRMHIEMLIHLDLLLRIHWKLRRIRLQSAESGLDTSQPHGLFGRHRNEMLAGTAKGCEKRALQ